MPFCHSYITVNFLAVLYAKYHTNVLVTFILVNYLLRWKLYKLDLQFDLINSIWKIVSTVSNKEDFSQVAESR